MGFIELIDFAEKLAGTIFLDNQDESTNQARFDFIQKIATDGYYVSESEKPSIVIVPVKWTYVDAVTTTSAGDISSSVSYVYSGF